MEIVLNKESKRKTPVAIAFRNDERTIGEDAYTIGVKFPSNMYFYLLELLGKTLDNPLVQLYQKRFPYYKLVEDPERKTLLFEHDRLVSFPHFFKLKGISNKDEKMFHIYSVKQNSAQKSLLL